MKCLFLAVVAVVAGVVCCNPDDDGWRYFSPHRYFGGAAPVVHIRPRPRFVVQQPQPSVYNHHPVWPYHFDDDHFDRKKRSAEPEQETAGVAASRQKRSPDFDFDFDDDDYHPWFRPSVNRVVYHRPIPSRTFAQRPTFIRPSFGHGYRFYGNK